MNEDNIKNAAKKYYDKIMFNSKLHPCPQDDFIEGAKSDAAKEYWREGLYCEEDMKKAFSSGELYADDGNYCINDGGGKALSFYKWFEIYKQKKMTNKIYTEKEKLEIGIDGYVNSWMMLCFKKRFRYSQDIERFKGSYQWVAEQAVKAYKEENNIKK